MSKFRIFAAIFLVAACAGGLARAQSMPDVASRCKNLESADLASVQDSPTQITRADMVGASGVYPAYCRVVGYVTSHVGIEIWLPAANWNHKFLEIGCGAYCGRSYISHGLVGCGEPLYTDRAQRRGAGLECWDRLGADEVTRRRARALDRVYAAIHA